MGGGLSSPANSTGWGWGGGGVGGGLSSPANSTFTLRGGGGGGKLSSPAHSTSTLREDCLGSIIIILHAKRMYLQSCYSL